MDKNERVPDKNKKDPQKGKEPKPKADPVPDSNPMSSSPPVNIPASDPSTVETTVRVVIAVVVAVAIRIATRRREPALKAASFIAPSVIKKDLPYNPNPNPFDPASMYEPYDPSKPTEWEWQRRGT